MKVQRCPSCRAGYSVERLEPGATFECRRCHATVAVASGNAGNTSVSIGLLVAGILTLVGLLLYANPSFGVLRSWPWEYVRAPASLPVAATFVVWALLGLWAALTAFLPGHDRRSLPTVALGIFALLVSCAPEGYALAIDLPRTLPWMAGVIALAAGFALLLQDRFGLATRLLLLAGGLVLAWLVAGRFEEDTARLTFLVDDVEGLLAGTLAREKAGAAYLWQTLAPQLAILLTAVLGLILGLGVRARPLAWVGGLLLMAAMLLPSATLVGRGLEGHAFSVARLGSALLDGLGGALIDQGVALWLIASLAVTDLVRTAEVPS